MLLCLVMLSAGAAFAADDTALVEATDEIAIEENVLPAEDIAVETDDVILAEATDDNIVTNDTFYNFFDEYNELLDNVTYDELIFEGEFSGLGDGEITIINRPITLSGSDAILNGISFNIKSYDVTIDGFTMIQEEGTCAIDAVGENIVISNNFINFTAKEGYDSYGIHSSYGYDSSYNLRNLQILNNTIIYTGNTDGTVVNNAVRIEADEEDGIPASSIVVSGNTFDIELPSVDVSYDPDTWAASVMSEGIVFFFCEDLIFAGNDVKVRYGDVTTAYGYDSIYAVSVKSGAYSDLFPIRSEDVVIANNTIDINGHSCAYALYVCADDFEVSGNNINSTSETYLAHGIDVDGPSVEGIVAENTIYAQAPDAAYGIYSYQYAGAIEDITYYKNSIEVQAYASAGMEIVECNPEIKDNIVISGGNYSYGVIASIRDEGVIYNNVFFAVGSNEGTVPTGDGLMTKNSMGISVKGHALIEENNVGSTNIGINLVEDGDITVTDNIISVEPNALIDSYGIYSKGLSNLTITDNEIEFIGNTDGTVVNNGLYVAGDDDEGTPASSIEVLGNTFDLELPSVDVYYDPVTWEASVMSEGIVFYYCEDLQFADNIVNVKYNNASGSYDSLYAVSVKSDASSGGEVQSSDILIADNTIELEGAGYAYGIYLCADEFEIAGNDITVTADGYLAHGIDVDGPSANGGIADNEITVASPMASYGVYSYAWMGAVEGLEVIDNEIAVDGYASAGIELKVNDPVVTDNAIVVDGNYTYGIIASVVEDEVGGVILRNHVAVLGSNVGDDATGDSFMTQNSMGISVKGTSLIENNTVQSTNIGINLVEYGESTINNNFIFVEANALIDSYGIYSKGLSNLTITDNEIEFIGNTDGTVVNNGLYVAGDDDEGTPASSIEVSGNTFRLELPSVDVYYDPVTWEANVMSEGIVFYYCEDLQFVENEVNVKYNNASGVYDSLYAVSVKSDASSGGEVQSSEILIADNIIELEGAGYAYGIYLCADEFEIAGNDIIVTADGYLAHGIDVDGPSANGGIADNEITVASPMASYGVYSYAWMGTVKGLEVIDNEIAVDGYASAGIELKVNDPVVTDNTIVVDGNYTYGIIASVVEDELGGLILRNDVTVLGSNVGDDATGDSFMTKNSMGISVKGTSLIENNTVGSTNTGINLMGEGEITVENNSIDVIANTGLIDNYAIVAGEIDELIIFNNEITYVGASNKTDDDKYAKAYAVYVYDSGVDVVDNQIDIVVPSIPNNWIDDGEGGWIRESYSEGLVFYGCNGSSITGNEITLTYDGGSYGSIYAVDVLDCDNFTIDDNIIHAVGESYLYGIIVEGDDFVISNNIISASSDYYANGIDIEESTGGLIDSNVIDAIAPESAYPIYGGMVGEPSVEITDNVLYGSSYFVVGVELSGSDATINDNIIRLNGNHTIGIGVYVDELIANNNTIISDASNIGDVPIWDSMGTNTTGIKSKKGTVTIIDNHIETTGIYSVDIADANGTVHDNYLVSENLHGDNSVYSTGDATVYYNIPPLKVVLFASDLVKTYDDGQLFVVAALDEDGEAVDNVTLLALVDSKVFRAVTDENGVAEFDIELPKGIYNVTTLFLGDKGHISKEIENTITVNAKESEIIAPEFAIYSVDETLNGTAVFNLALVSGDTPLANQTVSITFNGLTEEFTTSDSGNIEYIVVATAGNYTLEMAFAGDEFYAESNAAADITIIPIEAEIIAPKILEYSISEVIAGNATYSLTLVDADGNAIADRQISITFNGTTEEFTTDENGTVVYVINATAGNYTIDMAFEADGYYESTNASGTVVIKEEPKQAKIYLRNALYFVLENKIVNVTLWDADNNPIAGKTVHITIGNLTWSGVTDETGTAHIRVGIGFGVHDAIVSFDGDDEYAAANRTGFVRVIKETPSVMVRGANTQFKVADSPKTVNVYLWDRNSKPLPVGSKVAIKVNGHTYLGVTDSKGIAKIDMNINKAGTYEAEVKYAGNSAYNAVTRSVKFVIS